MTASSVNGPSSSHGRARADLQGLRAVAVLAVIGYHFSIPGMPGGFVGVDVFFVLSGFFITRLLLRELEGHGRIRFGRFWANRVKRLLPNSLLTILCVLATSALLLPHYRLVGISYDAMAAAAFFANFHFADRAVDYFHLDDSASPLLHYWSLAVEEQFYLALPLAMALAAIRPLFGLRTAIVVLLAVIATVSFAASLVELGHSQPDAFFEPWFRAWQLACGGLVGVAFDRREACGAARGAGAAIGLLAIVASILLLHDDMSYPGVWGLAPTLGTAALVFGVDAGGLSVPIRRVLEMPAMMVIGDMSYSLYLWHWPVAVFMAALWPSATGATTILAGLAVSGLLASTAYFLVERPVHRMELPARGLWRVLGAGAVGVAAVAGATTLPSRTDPAVAALIAEAAADLGSNYKNGCHRDFDFTDQPDCRFGHPGGPRVVLFGDSHAAQWFTPLVKAGEEAGWEVQAWTKTGCPTADVVIWYPRTRSVYEQCTEWRAARLRALMDDPPDLVVLGNFADYHGWIFDEARGRDANRTTTEKLWSEGMVRTGKALVAAGIRVVELRDTPSMYASYKDCLSAGEWGACVRPRDDALAGMPSPPVDSPLYIGLDLTDALCSAASCPAVIGGVIAYRDSNHLTASYAGSLYRHFLPLLGIGIVRQQ